jgi:hypothetical protein
VKEKAFWRNWFYRVHTIKSAYGLDKKPEKKPEQEPIVVPVATETQLPSAEVAPSSMETSAEAEKEKQDETKKKLEDIVQNEDSEWDSMIEDALENSEPVDEEWERKLKAELGIE